jgi:hypothetical protein
MIEKLKIYLGQLEINKKRRKIKINIYMVYNNFEL